jgi:hypothetical protein
MPKPIVATVLLLAALLGACRSTTPCGTLLASSPPGARILVNGNDSGFVTPCVLALAEGDRHLIRFELPGFEPAGLPLSPQMRIEFISWMEGYSPWSQLHFPLFLPFFDLFKPVRVNRALSPSRVHVRLHPTDRG